MASPPGDEADTTTPSGQRRRLRWPSSAGKQIAAAVSLASAVVGLTAGIVALVDRLRDDPPPERFARLAEVAVEPMTFGESLARRDLSTDDFTPARLACPVAFVNARVSTTGYEGATLPVRWQLFRAEGGFVASSRDEHELRPTADKRELDYPLAIPLPEERDRRYYAVVRVIDENGQVALASRRTAEFDSRSGPNPADCGVA